MTKTFEFYFDLGSPYKKGVFSTTSFVVNNKIFWEQDRLQFALNEASR